VPRHAGDARAGRKAHVAVLGILAVAVASACGSSASAPVTNVDLTGRWIFWDSSDIPHNIPGAPSSNPCILRMPLVLVVTSADSTGWLGTQDTGATIACGLDGPPGPPQPVPYIDRQFNISYRADSLSLFDASGDPGEVFRGRLRSRLRAEGRRDPEGGRHGRWTLTRPGL
jgi:hypothetical protein